MSVPNTKPIIPIEEYRKRWQKVQTMMNQQQLDLLVAYADDLAG